LKFVEAAMSDTASTTGPDLAQGVALDQLKDGVPLLGHVSGEAALMVRRGERVFAIGAVCTHYNGPLAEGLVVEHTVRCPWHHACFSLETGEALRAPALAPVACWSVDLRDGKAFAAGKAPTPPTAKAPGAPQRIVIVGGGAAGFAAAEMLRRQGFDGSVVMLSDDDAAPVDRPNLSKDYLAGTAPEDWVPLRPQSFYEDAKIDLRLRAKVTGIDTRAREVQVDGAAALPYDRLLLATGAEPVRLDLPGARLPHVLTLRTLADCRAIIGRLQGARSAVVVGAGFIGLEVAASLRTRGVEVHVVAPESRPMERILGPQPAQFIQGLHEEHGVVFHLENKPTAIDERGVTLQDGSRIDADLVIVGIGVRPRLELAERAGLAVDHGVSVDKFLQTSVSGIYAAGDIARWPDPHSGEAIRVEHWVVAERQGQVAALNMLGGREAFDAVPFFWSQHYDVPINVVGHAGGWDAIEVEGDIAARDAVLRYRRGGRLLAVASIYRDVDSLQAELRMEQAAAPA
jgi:NADPH-dependent 2,4-dienoyl-CoA reductase/sulfur reductase-like enzyme/nitrite reductase/ring-hydroxylating ferredoxin subunit